MKTRIHGSSFATSTLYVFGPALGPHGLESPVERIGCHRQVVVAVRCALEPASRFRADLFFLDQPSEPASFFSARTSTSE